MSDRELKRFRQLVRSRVRGRVAQTKEPPALTLYVSAGARGSKATVVPVGAARSAREVAENVRVSLLDKRPAFAAVVSTTTNKQSGKRGRGVAVVVAARSGEVETWQSEFQAGDLAAWEPGEFDPGSTADLLRQSWAELDRVERLEDLVERLRAIGERVREDLHTDLGVSEEEYEAAHARLSRVGELGEGCMAFLGEPGATAPWENERDFTEYVGRWLDAIDNEKEQRHV